MAKIKCGKANRGSQKWLQILINEKSELIDNILHKILKLAPIDEIICRSPLKNDDYAEYNDNDFLKQLNISLNQFKLEDFWPQRGPVWDGLAKAGNKIILVEAKSYIAEVVSNPSGAGSKSIGKIRNSLSKAKRYLGSKSKSDWSGTFYQYTNRLAHLYFLRKLNGIDAHLVFVYFLNDKDMKGPEFEDEWRGAIKLLHSYLGISHRRLSEYVHDIFIDVNELR